MAMCLRRGVPLVLLICLRLCAATPTGFTFLGKEAATAPVNRFPSVASDSSQPSPILLDNKGTTDDPWSTFANKWSPEVQAKINELKEEVQNATQAASKARRRERQEAKELAEERQIATAEAPSARVWEARIAQAQRGWEAAVAFLLLAVVGVYYLGHHRGAWGLNPMSLAEPLLPTNGQSSEDGPAQEKLRAELSQSQEATNKARAQELAAKRALQELQGQSAQMQAQLADAKVQDSAMRKALKEMQARVDANSVSAESQGRQEAAAMRQMQELQGQLQSEVAEARAQEAAAKKALHDVRAQAEADVKRAEKVMQEMHDELLFLRSRVGGMPMPPATPPLAAPPPLGLPLVAPLPIATAPPDLNPKLPELSPRGMPMRALSPAMVRPGSPPQHTMNVRAPSPAGVTSPGTSTSTFALNSPTSSHGHRGNTPQQQRMPHRGTASNPPSRFHLVAETSSCPGMAGGFGVGGVS